MISLMFGAFGGWLETLNALRIVKYDIEEVVVSFVALPAMAVLAIIEVIEALLLGLISLNLSWFLVNHIFFIILMMAAEMTNLH